MFHTSVICRRKGVSHAMDSKLENNFIFSDLTPNSDLGHGMPRAGFTIQSTGYPKREIHEKNCENEGIQGISLSSVATSLVHCKCELNVYN